MSNPAIETQPHDPEKAEQQQAEAPNMLTVIERAATNPDVDPAKMQQLLDVQERIINKQAETAFNRALAALEAELPVITHTGKIVIRGQIQSTYAKYEDIHKILSPLLAKHGFSLSFNTETVENGINIYGTLSHIDGHSKMAYIPLPFDTSGSKNNVQAVGSTLSYGKRYLVGMLINLVTTGEDDDGQAGGTQMITEEQAADLSALIEEVGANKAKFLDYLKTDSLENLPASKFEQAVKALEEKRKAGGKS